MDGHKIWDSKMLFFGRIGNFSNNREKRNRMEREKLHSGDSEGCFILQDLHNGR
jgi:hypothetical protein